MSSSNNYVYILECADGTYYTGWTNDLDHRVSMHNSGKGSKYVRSRLPARLIYYETYPDKRSAMHREYEIKRLSRRDKERLIEGFRIS